MIFKGEFQFFNCIFDNLFPIPYDSFYLLQSGNERNKCGMGKVIMKDLVLMFSIIKLRTVSGEEK
jgi:hypothetical protein